MNNNNLENSGEYVRQHGVFRRGETKIPRLSSRNIVFERGDKERDSGGKTNRGGDKRAEAESRESGSSRLRIYKHDKSSKYGGKKPRELYDRDIRDRNRAFDRPSGRFFRELPLCEGEMA